MTTTVNSGITGNADIDGRHLFRLTQALEDAIVFRRARAGTYCYDCDQRQGGRCDDHACDLDLIAGYEQDVLAISAAIGQGCTPIAPPHLCRLVGAPAAQPGADRPV